MRESRCAAPGGGGRSARGTCSSWRATEGESMPRQALLLLLFPALPLPLAPPRGRSHIHDARRSSPRALGYDRRDERARDPPRAPARSASLLRARAPRASSRSSNPFFVFVIRDAIRASRRALPRPSRRGSMSASASAPDAPPPATKKVLVPIADGTEEIEAVTVIDVLRRAGAEVVVMSVEDGRDEVTCSRGVRLVADKNVKESPAAARPRTGTSSAFPGACPAPSASRTTSSSTPC